MRFVFGGGLYFQITQAAEKEKQYAINLYV